MRISSVLPHHLLFRVLSLFPRAPVCQLSVSQFRGCILFLFLQ